MTNINKEHLKLLEQTKTATEAAVIAQRVAKEATKVAKEVVSKAEQTAEKVLLFSQTMEYIQKDIAEIKTKLDQKYVTKEEFSTVKAIVYGMVGLILTAVIIAVVSIVLK